MQIDCDTDNITSYVSHKAALWFDLEIQKPDQETFW